jgi:hypothetical protein
LYLTECKEARATIKKLPLVKERGHGILPPTLSEALREERLRTNEEGTARQDILGKSKEVVWRDRCVKPVVSSLRAP